MADVQNMTERNLAAWFAEALRAVVKRQEVIRHDNSTLVSNEHRAHDPRHAKRYQVFVGKTARKGAALENMNARIQDLLERKGES